MSTDLDTDEPLPSPDSSAVTVGSIRPMKGIVRDAVETTVTETRNPARNHPGFRARRGHR